MVRGLHIRVAMHGAWQADGPGGSGHVLVNYGRESSAPLAGLPHGPKDRCVVSTGCSARLRCLLYRSTRVSQKRLLFQGAGARCVMSAKRDDGPVGEAFNVVPGIETADSRRRRYVQINYGRREIGK